jgi:multisubunit Na+/H+ antiporter MnhF subunit
MFIFDWFGFGGTVDTGLGSVEIGGGFNAWQSFDLIDIILLLAIIAAVGVAAMSAYGTSANLPVAGSAIVAGMGALGTVLILYRIIDPPSGADREIGVFLGLIASAAMTYGGWEAMQEEGAYGAE